MGVTFTHRQGNEHPFQTLSSGLFHDVAVSSRVNGRPLSTKGHPPALGHARGSKGGAGGGGP